MLRALVPVCHIQVTDETAYLQWFQEKLVKQAGLTFIYTGRDHGYEPVAGNQSSPRGWMRITPYFEAMSLNRAHSDSKFKGGPVDFEEAVMTAMTVDPRDNEAFFLVPTCEAKLSDPRVATWVRRFLDTQVVNQHMVRTMLFFGTTEIEVAEALRGHIETVDERPTQEAVGVEFLKDIIVHLRITQDIEPVIPLIRGMSRAQISSICSQCYVHSKVTKGEIKAVFPELVAAYRAKIGLPAV